MKIIAPVLLLIILSGVVMAIPTKPGIISNSPVDLYLNKSIILNFTFSIDDENNTISYSFFENGSLISMDFNQTGMILSRSVGSYAFSLCANTINATNCSDIAIVEVIYSGVPAIGTIGEMTVTPHYSDSDISKRIFGLTIVDKNSVWVNASLRPSEEDYYDGDIGNSSEIECVEQSVVGDNHYFNCTINALRTMQPGPYDIKIISGNPYHSTEKSFQDKLTVNVLLSANVTLPELNLNDYYNGWAQSTEPIWVKNTGNVAFSEIGIATANIQCTGKSISTENILINYRMSRSSAVTCDPMSWFERKIYRGESQEFNIFVKNNATANNCKYIWDVFARWRE